MKTKTLFILIAFISVILLFHENVQANNASNELEQFVNNAIKELNDAPFKIPQFKDAVIDTVVPVDSSNKIENTNLHLCWLKNDKGRVGYIAIVESSSSFNVVAFSATTASPDYFLKNLKLNTVPEKQLNLSTAKQVSFIENMPLVATTKTMIGNESTEVSEISASLSSLLNYLQNKRDITFFGHIGSAMDSEYMRRFKADPNSGKEPNDKNWKSFEKEAEEVIKKENIPVGNTPEEKADSRKQQLNIVKPIIRRRLLNPVNAGERIIIIRAETTAIDSITKTNISSGMKDAILLQKNYLNGNISNLQKDLDILFMTRGRKAQIEITAFKQLKVEFLPAILLGTENNIGVLLGYLDIDGEIYASVFFPRTTKPNTMSLTQKLRENRIANNQPAEPDWEADQRHQDALRKAKEAEEKLRQAYLERGLPDPTPEKSIEERVRESMERQQAFTDKTLVVEDINSENPKSLENGVHIIKCSSLSSWQVLDISKIEVGNNW